MDMRWGSVALLSVYVAGHTMPRFCRIRMVVGAATVEETVAAIVYFRRTDAFHGKRKAGICVSGGSMSCRPDTVD